MPGQRIVITFTQDEQHKLETYVSQGHKNARTINRARILLLSNEGMKVKEIATVLGGSQATVSHVRKKYRMQEHAHILDLLQDEPRSGRPLTLDSQVEAKVSMLACSTPPQAVPGGPSICLPINSSSSMLLRALRMKASEVCEKQHTQALVT